MDSIVDLPIDQNYTTVLTIVDRFSKMCMLIPLSSTTAEHMARAFFQHVVAHYKLTHSIISDRDHLQVLASTDERDEYRPILQHHLPPTVKRIN